MHLLRRPRGLLFVTLAEPLLYPFRGIGGWRKDPYAKNVPLGRLRLFGGPYPTVDRGGLRFFVVFDACFKPIAEFYHHF